MVVPTPAHAQPHRSRHRGRAGDRLAAVRSLRRLAAAPALVAVPPVAAALGLAEDAIRSTGLPVQQVSCGVPVMIVPVATRDAVDGASPDPRLMKRHPIFYLYTTDRTGAQDAATVYTRMFAPELGIYEDPATGGASGPLGCYLVHHRVVAPDTARALLNLQGRKLGRPSWLHISIESANGAISRVRVGGESVFVAEGSFEV